MLLSFIRCDESNKSLMLLCQQVAEDFIDDPFNLTDLRTHIPNYKQALDRILDRESGKLRERIRSIALIVSNMCIEK